MSTQTVSAVDELQQMEADINSQAINNMMNQSGTTERNGNTQASDGPSNGSLENAESVEKRPSRGDVLAFLEENADQLPGGAESFREIQRSLTSQSNTNKELAERLEALEKANEKPPEPSPEEVKRQQLLSRIPKHEREKFQAMIDEMGLVSRDEIEQEKAIEESTKLTAQSIEKGVEQWGDDFGKMEDGQFVWNPEIYEGVRELYRSLKNPEQGITPNHLYILHNYEKLIADAQNKGQSESEYGERMQRLVKANSMNRSSTSVPRSDPSLRQDGDTLEDITAKAVKKAWNRIVHNG
jgi:hypothetical protein